MARYGMVIDLKRCMGCNACTVACRAENATRPGILWSYVKDVESGTYPQTQRAFLPVLCMQCSNPPCVGVCPVSATYKRPDGIVSVDYGKCIGCRLCQGACPYEARYYNGSDRTYFPAGPTPYERAGYAKHRLGTVEKCDFCMERVQRGQQPACVETCITQARYFGHLDDPNSEVSKLIARRKGYTLKPELGTQPAVYYLP